MSLSKALYLGKASNMVQGRVPCPKFEVYKQFFVFFLVFLGLGGSPDHVLEVSEVTAHVEGVLHAGEGVLDDHRPISAQAFSTIAACLVHNFYIFHSMQANLVSFES